MKKIFSILIFVISLIVIYAQEGNPYIGIYKYVEKTYDVKQKHGIDKMKLVSRTTGFYDANGLITRQIITKGNYNYDGKVFINRSTNPETEERLIYNSNNLLQTKWIKVKGAQTGEYTEIQYSSRGKILEKIVVRVDTTNESQWQFVYNALGYVPQYYKLITDSLGNVLKKTQYNYNDDVISTTAIYYNSEMKPLFSITTAIGDTILKKIDYAYDDKGNLIKETEFDKSGREVSIKDWYYDENNRLIQYNYSYFDPRFGGVPKLRQTKIYEYYTNIDKKSKTKKQI